MQKGKFEQYLWLWRTAAIAATLAVMVICYNKQMHSPTRLKGDINIFVNIAESIYKGEHPYIDPEDGYMFVYPPMSGVVFIPFIGLPIWVNVLWLVVLNTVLVGVSILLGYEAMTGKRFRAQPLKTQWAIATLTILLGARYIVYEISSGQVNLIVMSLTMLGLWLITKQKSVSGGIALGIGISFKLLTLPLGLWYLAKQRWKLVGAIVLGGIVWITLPSVFLGVERNIELFSYFVVQRVLKNAPTATELPFKHIDPTGIALQADNISISAQMIRLFTNTAAFEHDGVLHSITILELPKMWLSIFKAALILLLLLPIPYYAYRYRHKSARLYEWGGVALACATVPAFLPQAHQYHVVALLPAWLYFAIAIVEWRVRDKWFIGYVGAAFAITLLTSPDIIGWYLAKLTLAYGAFLFVVVLTIAAIFRLTDVCDKFGIPEDATEKVETEMLSRGA
jgi:hypothetical protein